MRRGGAAVVPPLHALELAERVQPVFAGHSPELVGGALAELTATWLCGHVERTIIATEKTREGVLLTHVRAVRRIVMQRGPRAAL